MKVGIAVSLLSLSLALFLLSRIRWVHEALGVFDRIGSVIAALTAIIVLVLPYDNAPEQTSPSMSSPTPTATATPAPSNTPASTPSPVVTPTPATGILEETVVVGLNDTKWVFNKELSISVNQINYDTVTATIGVEDGATQTIKQKGVGYISTIRTKKTYRVTIAKIEVIGSRVTFRVTANAKS